MTKDFSSPLNNKLPDKSIKISKWGNSQGIRLSKDDLNKAGFKVEETIDLYVEDNKIILEKPKKELTLEELFANYDGDYHPEEWDTGESIGDEIL